MRIAFIINPISGTSNKQNLRKLIAKNLDDKFAAPDIIFTSHKGHAHELAKLYAEKNYYAVIAVGGDGTVNEVASALVQTNTALGIVPSGSGNGLANHLRIPLNTTKAISQLNRSEIISVDYATANDRPFFCTCGIGFDAFVGYEFAKETKRGFFTYIEKVLSGYFKYSPENYRLVADNVDIETKALVITFANANQWGNNAYIAPQASIQDGLLDVTIITNFPALAAPTVALRLFTKTINDDYFVNTIKTKEITLYREQKGIFHYDGEPIEEEAEIHIKVIENGLKLIVPRRY